MKVTLNIPGNPAPGGSKNHFVNPRTGKICVVDAGGVKNKEWRQDVAMFARQHMRSAPPLTQALSVVAHFFQTRPKSHYKSDGITLKPSAPARPTTRPDATKLWRSTEDALTGIIWKDDSQVVSQVVAKYYRQTPGAVIFIGEATE